MVTMGSVHFNSLDGIDKAFVLYSCAASLCVINPGALLQLFEQGNPLVWITRTNGRPVECGIHKDSRDNFYNLIRENLKSVL
jgi:hypothetical protein